MAKLTKSRIETKSTANKLALNFAIVCDDVRKEINGKDIIVGVYTASIIVSHLPAVLPLWLYINYTASQLRANQTELTFRVLDSGGRIILQSPPSTIMLASTQKQSMLAFGAMPINIQSSGTLTFQWKQNSQEWENLTALDIIVGDPFMASKNPTTVSPPPSAQSPPDAPESSP